MRSTRKVLHELSDAVGRMSVAVDRNSDVVEDLRITVRDMNRRQELVLREVVGALRDLREETTAQTAAIFKVLERLDGGAAGAAG